MEILKYELTVFKTLIYAAYGSGLDNQCLTGSQLIQTRTFTVPSLLQERKNLCLSFNFFPTVVYG